MENELKVSRNDRKRLAVDIDNQLHWAIRSRAALKNITIKKWILQAIFEKIQDEKKSE